MRMHSVFLLLNSGLLVVLFVAGCSLQTAYAVQSSEEKHKFQRRHSVYDMVADFVSEAIPNQETIDMNIRKYDDYGGMGRTFFLNAKIKNNFDESICIPTIFYSGENIIALEMTLSLRDENGRAFPYRMYASKFEWPSKKFVIIYPGQEDITYINLSSKFSFDERMGPVEISFAFPAFFCRTLKDAYPISEEMALSPFGLRENEPVVAVKKEDMIVYRGTKQFRVNE